MDYKILSIIPCKENMFAVFGEDNIKKPIVCLAMIEYPKIDSEEALVEIVPMCMNESGEVFNPTECSDFNEMSW